MPVMTYLGHSNTVTTVQMDDRKIISGDGAGFVRVWDQRMGVKLWEWHNRYCEIAFCTRTSDPKRLLINPIMFHKMSKMFCICNPSGLLNIF